MSDLDQQVDRRLDFFTEIYEGNEGEHKKHLLFRLHEVLSEFIKKLEGATQDSIHSKYLSWIFGEYCLEIGMSQSDILHIFGSNPERPPKKYIEEYAEQLAAFRTALEKVRAECWQNTGDYIKWKYNADELAISLAMKAKTREETDRIYELFDAKIAERYS